MANINLIKCQPDETLISSEKLSCTIFTNYAISLSFSGDILYCAAINTNNQPCLITLKYGQVSESIVNSEITGFTRPAILAFHNIVFYALVKKEKKSS